jgi:hypothetical protein
MLPFGPVHNVGLFSSHWLEHRLELEPEWQELRDEAGGVLKSLAELWKVERSRVERYGDEQGLEVGFIQPVLFALGWKLKYQTFVQGREPDYALFLDDEALDAALAVDRTSPDFWAWWRTRRRGTSASTAPFGSKTSANTRRSRSNGISTAPAWIGGS